MKMNTRFSLSFMMFFEFFIWGAWYVTMSTYLAYTLHASQLQIGAAYSALSIATIISPFFVGMIADRFFEAQRVLGILHLLGAVLLYILIQTKRPDVFFWLMLLYSLMYAPTLALANSVAFHQMKDPGKQFPGVRVWGTIGWIATGWLIDKVFHIQPEQFAFTFKMAAVASLILGIFSFALPHTPPQAKNEKATFKKILGADALVLLKNRSYLVFFIASILICIPLSFYYTFTNQFLVDVQMKNVTSNMTYGQIFEAGFILLIPFLIKRIGIKNMILLGMFAWILRFTCFAYGNAGTAVWMLFVGIILHGVCFDFFFVTGQIYTDFKAGEKIKSSAQGLITMATYGIGMWIGTLLSGYVSQYFTTPEGVHLWRQTWLTPAAIAAAVLIFFLLAFRERIRSLTPAQS